MPTKQIFISYKREDRPRVKELADNLRRAGNTVWFDESLQVGDHWWDAILGQIEQCDVFVFAISQRALRSIPCQHERAYATALGKPLLLIQVGPLTAVPTEYAKIQYENFSKGDPRTLFDLVGAINRLPPDQPNNPNVPRPAAPIAPIEELAAIIDTQEVIEFKDQAEILFRLKQAIDGPQARTQALDLVEALSKRTEFVQIQEDCKTIIAANKAPKRPPVGLLILGAVVILAVIAGIGGIALVASRSSITPTITPASVALNPTTTVTVTSTLPPTATLTPSITNTPQPTGTPTITLTPSITDTPRPTQTPIPTSIFVAQGVKATNIEDFTGTLYHYFEVKGNGYSWNQFPLGIYRGGISNGMGVFVEFQIDLRQTTTTQEMAFSLSSGDPGSDGSLGWSLTHYYNTWSLAHISGSSFVNLMEVPITFEPDKWYDLLWRINANGTLDTLIWSKGSQLYILNDRQRAYGTGADRSWRIYCQIKDATVRFARYEELQFPDGYKLSDTPPTGS